MHNVGWFYTFGKGSLRVAKRSSVKSAVSSCSSLFHRHFKHLANLELFWVIQSVQL